MTNRKLKTVPLTLDEANAFVAQYHRHHKPVHRDKYRVGCTLDGKLCGVVQVGRPVSRVLDDGLTVEVVRLCTTGEKNVCSFLYAKAARIAKEMGFESIITYILNEEDGKSLKAAGWQKECDTKGHSWNCPSRPRSTSAPECGKQRYRRWLNDKP